MAPEAPERLFIGIDANAAGLRRLSGRAAHARIPNVVYVRAAVEALPPELDGIADRVTIVLPWGSLLATVARPAVSLLRGVRSLCQPGAILTVVIGVDPARDGAELRRLGLHPLADCGPESELSAGYGAAGFVLTSVRALHPEDLAQWPSTWARRLAHGSSRSFSRLEARATV